MRLTLLVLLLTLASGAQAAPDIPMGGQVGSPQPTTLEGLAADLLHRFLSGQDLGSPLP